jgi:HEAT repeat protein
MKVDFTPPLEALHASRCLRVLAWWVMGSALATGCRGSKPSFQDEERSASELRAMLVDGDPEVQARGALGLSRLGANARDAVPDLITLLKSPATLARQNAALALGAIGPEASPAVPALTEALKDPEWAVRRQAALALGMIGASAKPALPALKLLDRDPQKPVREAAKRARERIGE